MTESVPLLSARALTVWRDENLLFDSLDISLGAGEALCIAGSNGSGKTTLLRALIGLAEIDEGEVFWRGEPLRRTRESLHAALIYIGHRSGLAPELTALENLRYLSLSASDRDDDTRAALNALGLADRAELPCGLLSAGQKRRVMLARLALEPASLWVLDEPLTSLDRAGCRWVIQAMDEQLARGAAVLFTSHQPIELDAGRQRSIDLDLIREVNADVG